MTGLFRRAPMPALLRRMALAIAAIAITGSVATTPAVASPGASDADAEQAAPSGASIDATQAQVAVIEAQAATEQQTLAQLSESYDEATVHLQQIDAQLSATATRLAAARKRHAAAVHVLRVAAVNAYVYDTPSSQITSMFSTPSETTSLHDEYQQTAEANINHAVAQLASSERQLTATESTLHAQQQQAAADTSQVGSAQQSARATAATTEATLSQVKGQLAQLVAQRAAAAAQAAQVAEQFGAGSAAAVQATNAANQASASAGATVVIGTGAVQSATGPGALALRGAERYLGVPYEWGGAGAAGLDCSGLTMLAWRAAGVSLLHSAAIQYDESVHVPLSQVRPGDLLFYDLDGDGIDHVVMYVGSGPYGADTIIQAAHTGTVVEFDPVWDLGLVGAGRP